MSRTVAAEFFEQRREEFNANAAYRALTAMRKGAQLRLEYRGGKPSWSLSGGRAVTPEVAFILTNHALVVPADAALFVNLPGQQWVYRND
jgi:hypothetical protein